jgi:hypothetical protein
MKRIVLLISFIAAIGLCASAQTYIDFHQMPIARTPAPMPDNFPEGMYLAWDNFFYVTPGIWNGEGPGFWVDPTTQHNIVAFVGGPLCDLAATCHGSIKLMVGPNVTAFTPVQIQVTAGWLPNRVIVTAYSNGRFVGRTTWNLTTDPQTFTFPNAWSDLTQLIFTPEFVHTNSIYPPAGSMLIYKLVLMMH